MIEGGGALSCLSGPWALCDGPSFRQGGGASGSVISP